MRDFFFKFMNIYTISRDIIGDGLSDVKLCKNMPLKILEGNEIILILLKP